MSRTFIVASSEFLTLIRTKAFLIGVFLMPVFMGGAIVMQKTMMERPDTERREFAVVDHTGVLYEPLARAAEARNRAVTSDDGTVRAGAFVPSQVETSGRRIEDIRLELSDRIRREELFAFVEIPAAVLELGSTRPAALPLQPPGAQRPAPLAGGHARPRDRPAPVRGGVARPEDGRSPDPHAGRRGARAAGAERPGEITEATEVDRARTFAIPVAFMMMMFLLVMTSSPQLLNSVIEEKMSRISEVLVASVTPFQLMMGKLLGSVGVSLVLATVYLAGGYGLASYWGYGTVLTPGLIASFFFYLVLAVLLFGSMFIAIGAACTDLKDAQNMMTPAMMLAMFPIFTWTAVIRAPESGLAIAASLLPFATPFIMLLRIALQPAPPIWQIVLSTVLVGATVMFAVWAAGRIFRAGLLMHGKAATPREMLRWIILIEFEF